MSELLLLPLISSRLLHTLLKTTPVDADVHGLMKPTEIRHLKKIRDTILRFSSPQLRLEILSMSITNRIQDKGQSWRGQTPIDNVSDFVQRMWTQLSLYIGTRWLVTAAQNPQTSCRLDELL